MLFTCVNIAKNHILVERWNVLTRWMQIITKNEDRIAKKGYASLALRCRKAFAVILWNMLAISYGSADIAVNRPPIYVMVMSISVMTAMTKIANAFATNNEVSVGHPDQLDAPNLNPVHVAGPAVHSPNL